MKRPAIAALTSGQQFNNWYWLKAEMQAICKHLRLPTGGSKFALRDRIIYALDHDGQLPPALPKPKPTSTFKWASEELGKTTVITDNIIFGQNLRRFFETTIGPQFSFNIDFMAWMKNNTGKTLADAITVWKELEARKKDPNFRTDIADHNMFNQYTRDYLEDHPAHGMKEVRIVWAARRQQPAPGGYIRYKKEDAELLSRN